MSTQHELTTPGSLLDADGRITQTGWARQVLKAIERLEADRGF